MSEDDGIISKGGKRPPGPPPSLPVARKTPPAPPSSSHKLEALAKTLHAWDSTHLWTDVPGHERNVWLWKAQLAFEAMEAAQASKPDLDAYERGRADERAARDNEVEQWVASVQSLVDRDVVPTMEALFTREPADPTPVPQLQPDWCGSCQDRHSPAMCCSAQVGWEKDGELISLNQCSMKYGAKWRSPKWMKAEGWQPVFVRGVSDSEAGQ